MVYYFKANEQLIVQPAYVGSMQTRCAGWVITAARQRRIYARSKRCHCAASKELFMRVTGTLTDSVRRALHMP
jgi:hypothetical protein